PDGAAFARMLRSGRPARSRAPLLGAAIVLVALVLAAVPHGGKTPPPPLPPPPPVPPPPPSDQQPHPATEERLGDAAMEAKNWKGALVHYERAIVQSPESRHVYSKMTELYFTLGREGDARAASERTLELDLEDGPALAVWAWTHGTKDHATAFEH